MEKVRLGSQIKQIRGVSYKPTDLHNDLNDNSVILLRANNISDGKLNFDDVVYVDKSKVKEEQYLKKGDILVCASSGSKELVGKAAFVKKDFTATFGAFCKLIRPMGCIAEYLGHYFNSPTYREKISALALGANINNIRNEHIDELFVCFPNELEQKSIASLLDKVTNLIDKRKEQLSKLDELVKARFVELFGDPKENPKGYCKKQLKETCNVITGNTPSRAVSEYYGEHIEWIKTDNIVSELINPTTATEYLSEKGLAVGRTVEKDSILMACIAGSISSIGRVCITDRKVAFNQQINAIVPNDYNTLFLYVMLQISKEYLVEGINMALKGILSKSKLEEKEFIVPPMELQEEFATFVKQTDKSKLELQKSLEKLELLKKALMQKYFG